MIPDVTCEPGTLGALYNEICHAVAQAEARVRKEVSEADPTGVLRSEFVHAFTTKSSNLHIFVGPTRQLAIPVLEIADTGARVLVGGYFRKLSSRELLDLLDTNFATLVHDNAADWVTQANVVNASKVSEAEAVIAFDQALAAYNKSCALQL